MGSMIEVTEGMEVELLINTWADDSLFNHTKQHELKAGTTLKHVAATDRGDSFWKIMGSDDGATYQFSRRLVRTRYPNDRGVIVDPSAFEIKKGFPRTSNKARRLFQERPDNVFEHPTDLPVPKSEIPLGPIEGWVCFAPRMNGDPSQIIGPFVPVVQDEFDDGGRCIITEDGTNFWYDPESTEHGRRGYPCWFQSGSTLRFVKARKKDG